MLERQRRLVELRLVDPLLKKRDMIDTDGTRKRRPIPLMVQTGCRLITLLW